MLGVIIWIIIIWVVVVKIKQQQGSVKQNKSLENRGQQNFNTSSSSPSRNTQRSSYYREDKVDSYKRMNADHALHDGDEGDLTDEIGYIKCPHCGATVSKKSKECFMCDKPLN